MFKFGSRKLGVVRSDLIPKLSAENQNPIDLLPISDCHASFGFQLVEAVLNALQSVIGKLSLSPFQGGTGVFISKIWPSLAR